jgi:crossover junction endodeoxyribonuclease RusA
VLSDSGYVKALLTNNGVAMSELRIVLPWPEKCLSPNSRAHWATVMRAKASARHDAAMAATAAIRTVGWKTVENARTRITFYATDSRKRDGDNHLAMLKSYLDGFADAGVIANDCGFAHEAVRFEKCKQRHVEIVVASE